MQEYNPHLYLINNCVVLWSFSAYAIKRFVRSNIYVQTHTFISHTQAHTRILFLYPSVAKVANNRVGRGEFEFPPNVQSPFIWANQTVPSLTTSVCALQTVQSSCSNSLEPQVLMLFWLDCITRLRLWIHHAYNTDGDGIWLSGSRVD